MQDYRDGSRRVNPSPRPLSQPQVTVLVLWSFGIVLAQSAASPPSPSCGLSPRSRASAPSANACATGIAMPHKCGQTRPQTPQPRCAHLLSSPPALGRGLVAAGVSPTGARLDASTLGQRFTILTISVVVRGCAIPVAWHIVEATRRGRGDRTGKRFSRYLHGQCADRLDSHRRRRPWLVCQMAVSDHQNAGLASVSADQSPRPVLSRRCPARFRPLSQVSPGSVSGGPGRDLFCDQGSATACTLLARWDRGYTDPWLILTDLPTAQADVAWYGLRAWIKCGFKDAKRGGWHWDRPDA